MLTNQNDIVSALAVIATLEKALSNCEAQVAEKQAALPDVGPLSSQREDLLAAIAIGEATSADLEKLDAQMDKLKAQRNGEKPALDALKQTIEGLQRRWVDARKSLQKLRAERESLLRHFLIKKAEAVGAEYFAAAQALVARYKELRGLDALIPRSPVVTGSLLLHVPRFNLETVPSLMPVTWAQDVVFETKSGVVGSAQEWAQQEAAALLELGIAVNDKDMPGQVEPTEVVAVAVPAAAVSAPLKGQRLVNPDLGK